MTNSPDATGALSYCFIGGWGTNDEIWRGILYEASRDGFGKGSSGTSDAVSNDAARAEVHFLSWLDCIRDWPGVLASLAVLPGRCVLVGWSLGSVLALRAASELRDTASLDRAAPMGGIAAMLLVSATPCMCAGSGAGGDHGGIGPRTLAAMQARMKRSPGAVLEDFAAECAAPDGDEETRLGWLRQARRFSAEEMAAGLDCLASLDVRERLSAIGVPCRILHGECDRIVPLRSARFLAERISSAELEVLPGRGHALPLTAPAEVARSIRRAKALIEPGVGAQKASGFQLREQRSREQR